MTRRSWIPCALLFQLAAVSLFSFLAAPGLVAQEISESRLVRNWPAPLFWRATEGLAAAVGESSPEEKTLERLHPEQAQVAAAPLPFVAVAPCRMLDTRIGGVPINSGTPRDATLTGPPCGIPSNAAAVSANFAVFNIVGALGNGVLKVWPAGSPSTFQALLNWSPTAGQIDNASVVPLGTAGAITVQPNQGGGSIDLVIDVNGYYGGSVVTDITAGPGLTGGGTGSVTLNLSFGGSGSATTASHSDHTHSTADITSGLLADARLGGTYSNALTLSNAANSITAASETLGGNINLLTEPSTAVGGSIFKNGVWFLHDYGQLNTFVGLAAGNFTMTGGGANVGIGYQALARNSSGGSNTALGALSLQSNTTGTDNTACGYAALGSNTTGNANTACGFGALASNTSGLGNTASGDLALSANTAGNLNTASGYQSLFKNIDGSDNVAIGNAALYNNLHSSFNTAVGNVSLAQNTTGESNTACGYAALNGNTTGVGNTGSGAGALSNNTTGASNTATGNDALSSNSDGYSNTASGYQALLANTHGFYNTAGGYQALYANTTGGGNTASGLWSLFSNIDGFNNVAVGNGALYSNTHGNLNIAIGLNAGYQLTTGDNNIDIGHVGFAGEASTIRIGTIGTHNFTYLAGVNGATIPSGVNVLVSGSGKLGTMTSSRRFKEDIRDLGEASRGLFRLRPVTFRYKPEIDPTGLEQYGLIAEEVAEVYPDLVVYGDDGKAQTVRYHFLVPMLLNEVQRDRRMIEGQRELIQEQIARTRELAARLLKLEELVASHPASSPTETGMGPSQGR